MSDTGVSALGKGEPVVHGLCGVGYIRGRERMTVARESFDAVVVDFPSRSVTLRVPATRASSTLRPLASRSAVERAFAVLREKPAKAGRGAWIKKAALLDAKITSGDLIATAEVARDLHRTSVRSDTERQICARAVGRIGDEVALVLGISRQAAAALIGDQLSGEMPAPLRGCVQKA